MDLRDWYFQQLVTEADLDEAFTLAQAADQNYVIDNGQVGVYFGLDVAEAGVPNLTVQVSAGAAYDQTGQRMAVPSTQIVNVAVDSNAVSTTVAGVGNSKIVSVYIKFKRVLGNPKTDGNNASIQYDRDEGYEFIVRQSTEAVGPTPSALQADEILLGDWTRAFGVTTFVDADWSTARRQWSIDATNGAYSVKTGRVDTAIQSVLDVAGNHIAEAAGAHAASAISYAGTGTWADATTNPATTVELQLDKIVTELAANAGAAKIGSVATGDVIATTVQTALDELASEKGNRNTTNTWSAVNTFTDSMALTSASGAKTVTHKLLSSTGASETSRYFEVYATGTPSSIGLETPPDEHVTNYEVSVVICRQGSITNTQCALITGGVYRTGGVQTLIGSDEVSSVGAEGGPLALALSGGLITLSLSAPVNPMNIRLVVRAHSVKAAA